MQNNKTLFIADTAFLNKQIIKQHQLLSVFPEEVGDKAYRASLDEMLQRSKLQSAYYDELLPKLIPVLKMFMPDAESEVKRFVSPILFSVTSFFVDRCIRVLHRVRQCEGENIAAVAVEPIDNFQWLHNIVQSWQLNQDAIQRIMVALGYEKVVVLDRESYPEYPSEHTQANLIFSPQRPGLSGILSKPLSRFFNLLERIPNERAKFQSLGFTVDRYYMAKRGLIGPFSSIRSLLKVELESSVKNIDLREKLLVEIEEIIKPPFKLLLSEMDHSLNKKELNQLSQVYTRLFIDWFPVGFLEGLSSNLEKVRQSLKMDNAIGIIGHSMTTPLGYFASAITRLAGKTVFGVQHAPGHYGYIEDHAPLGPESAFCDKLITWGWTRIDEHLPQCETIPLPSPKNSEQPFKANYLKGAKSKSKDMRDILFLSNLFHRFPDNFSTCGQSRPDFIDEITNAQEDLMLSINNSGLTITHKPYNMKYIDLYPEHFRRLAVAGGAGYHFLKSTHKGLTVGLIKTCRILLWDQIGCGTMEALTSGVPTIIYWKRIYSREASHARDLVAALEQYGVVHSDADTLAQEIRAYLADPEAWMNNEGRKQAIKAFCQKFALTDPRWYEKWKTFLSNTSMPLQTIKTPFKNG
jgi:putative transferase (TIGR04331 family)